MEIASDDMLDFACDCAEQVERSRDETLKLSGGTITQHHLVLNTTEGKLEVTAAKTLSLATVQKQCEEAIARTREALDKSRV